MVGKSLYKQILLRGYFTQIEAVYKRNDQDGDGKLSRDEYNLLVNRRH